MSKQRSKSQRARRNERRRFRRVVRAFYKLADEANMGALHIERFNQRYIIAMDGTQSSSVIVWDTKLNKIEYMDNDDE